MPEDLPFPAKRIGDFVHLVRLCRGAQKSEFETRAVRMTFEQLLDDVLAGKWKQESKKGEVPK